MGPKQVAHGSTWHFELYEFPCERHMLNVHCYHSMAGLPMLQAGSTSASLMQKSMVYTNGQDLHLHFCRIMSI